MSAEIPFFYLLLVIGQILKQEPAVTAEMMQEYIYTKSETFRGTRALYSECEFALQLMEGSGFIVELEEKGYYGKDKTVVL